MTEKRKIRKGDILVCIKTQRYGCGKMKLRENGLVKAMTDEDYDEVEVARSKDYEENSWNWLDVAAEKMRFATEEEATRYDLGIRIV